MASGAFDRRRVNGPEESFHPIFDDNDEQPLPSRTRSANEIRPIYLKTGLITQAAGSAYIETGNMKIACAIYGPRQASKSAAYDEKGKLNVEVKFAPFSCTQRRTPLRDAEDSSVSQLIHQSLLPAVRLELFPKSIIDVFIIVLENDGTESCVASGTVAASAALSHAGIEMLALVVSCSSCVVKDKLWLDPTEADVKQATGVLTLAAMPALGTITNVWQEGQMTTAQAFEAISLCEQECQSIHAAVAQELLADTTV